MVDKNTHPDTHEVIDKQQEIKLQREALIEYAENDDQLSEAERILFIEKSLSDPDFFRQACEVLQDAANILWWAASLDEVEHLDGNEADPFLPHSNKFLDDSKNDSPGTSLMRLFYLKNWEQAFTRECIDPAGNPILDENGEAVIEVSLDEDQYKLCESRILRLHFVLLKQPEGIIWADDLG